MRRESGVPEWRAYFALEHIMRKPVILILAVAFCGRVPGAARAQALPATQASQATQERAPFAGVHCLAVAQQALHLADQTAYALCLGAGSDTPVQCFAAAREHTLLADPQIVGLCRCALSTAPVECYLQARAQAFLLDDQLMTMCSAIVTQQLFTGDCAMRRD